MNPSPKKRSSATRRSARSLSSDPKRILRGTSPDLRFSPGGRPGSAFLSLSAKKGSDRHEVALGAISGLKRWVAMARLHEPFWMRTAFGSDLSTLPAETQYLLAERTDGSLLLIAPLVGSGMRFSLAVREGSLLLVGETNDPEARPARCLAAYVAAGRDLQSLAREGALAVCRKLGTVKPRTRKRLPDFADDLGWCTWDAFYHEVTPSGVRAGLEAFRRGGIRPGFLILDDGWQDYAYTEVGHSRLMSLKTHPERFSKGIAPLVSLCKEEFGIRRFLVWHAFMGYWSGVDPKGFSKYGAVTRGRNHGVEMLKRAPNANLQWWGHYAGVIPPDGIGKFYEDLHRGVAAAGVDGVKVDVQSMIEGLSTGDGGRVAMTGKYKRELEASVKRHFGGRLINCMSHANDLIYQTSDSALMRSSDDFYPLRTEMHGLHLKTNSHFGVWFGQFVHPDWDMFHSRHPWGSYHAAGRAVSGSPVYVSDKPGHHDFALLAKLAFPDGRVLRMDAPGVPTRDCLFHDVQNEAVALKIANTSGERGVLGLFNARIAEPRKGGKKAPDVAVTAFARASDVPGLADHPSYAVSSHAAGKLARVTRGAGLTFRLPEKGWEILTYAPIERGFAAIGLADMLAGAAAVTSAGWRGNSAYRVALSGGGRFLAYSEKRVTGCTFLGKPVAWSQRGKRLSVNLPRDASGTLEFAFA